MRANSPRVWQLSLLLCFLLSSESTRAADLYVATDGNDSWSGTFAKANPERSDGPFRTIGRARDAVRQLKAAQGGLKGPVRILLRGGVYHLTETLQLGPEDSGAEGAVVSYEAFPGETPVISGGRAIRNWRRHDGTVWVADVPWVVDCEDDFTQLFVDGHRRVRARTPNQGKYFYTKRLRLTTGRTPICLGLTFFEEDIQPWDGLKETGRVVLFHNWVGSAT